MFTKIIKIVVCINLIFAFTIGCSEVKEYVIVDNAKVLNNYEGQKISIQGTISALPYQHPVNIKKTHPVITYVNTGSYQIVVYVKQDVVCKHNQNVKINGTVIKIQANVQDSTQKEFVTEYQILADKVECLQ